MTLGVARARRLRRYDGRFERKRRLLSLTWTAASVLALNASGVFVGSYQMGLKSEQHDCSDPHTRKEAAHDPHWVSLSTAHSVISTLVGAPIYRKTILLVNIAWPLYQATLINTLNLCKRRVKPGSLPVFAPANRIVLQPSAHTTSPSCGSFLADTTAPSDSSLGFRRWRRPCSVRWRFLPE
jgi:hypothetical protein